MLKHEGHGFTLIEVVLTLVLIGVLGFASIGLFASKDRYLARTVADQLLSQARLAQQVALATAADSGSAVNLQLSRTADEITSRVNSGDFDSQRSFDANGVVVSLKTSGTTACGGGSDSDFTLEFDGNGNLTGDHTDLHLLICTSGQLTIPICITPQGYAYEAVCES